MDIDSTPIPDVVVDVWAKSLSPSQLRLVLMLLRRGYRGRRGLPHSQRYLLAGWLGLTRDVVYRTLTELTRSGAVLEVLDGAEVGYAVAVDWIPPTPIRAAEGEPPCP